MKKFIFGSVPSAALKPPDKPESSKANKPPKTELHHSSWSNLYHRLVGPGETKSTTCGPDDEYVRWDGSSSPIGKQRKPEMSTSSPNRADELESPRPNQARSGTKQEDPATELFNKYNNDMKIVNLSCPNEHELSKASSGVATPCRRTTSAVAAIPVTKTNEMKSTIFPPLYSPGYLKRSISFDRNLATRKKRNTQKRCISMPEQKQSHVQELLILADDMEKEEKSPVRRLSLPASPAKGLSLPASSPVKEPSSPFKEPSSPVKGKQSDEIQPHNEISAIIDSDSEDDIDIDELDRLISQQSLEKGSMDKLSLDKSSANGALDLASSDRASLDKPSLDLASLAPIPTKSEPAFKPSIQPIVQPTVQPTIQSTMLPTVQPTIQTSISINSSDFEDDSSDEELDFDELNKQITAESQLISTKSTLNQPIIPSDNIKSISKNYDEESQNQPLFSTVIRHDCLRFRVISVKKQSDQIILSVIQQNPQQYNQVILKQHWYHENCIESGDIINVVFKGPNSQKPQGPTIIVDNKQNLVIVNPDVLLTATAVAEAAVCRRKVVLRERIRGIDGELSKYILFGSIIHELFQDCLVTNDFSISYLESRLSELVHGEYLAQVVLAGLSCQQAEKELHENYLNKFEDWKKRYFSGPPNENSDISDARNGKQTSKLSITKILDIEQEIWSPVFGLKGKIDATVEAHLKDNSGNFKSIVPFELKTSKSSQSITHRAQTVLYTLLLSEANHVKQTPFGILCYIAMNEMVKVSVLWDEIRALLITRNALAAYSKHTVRPDYDGEFNPEALPPPVRDDFLCKRCDWNQVCMVHSFAQEKQENVVPEIFELETEHLTDKHRQFFNHWSRLIGIEGGSLNLYRRQIWTMTSKQRELTGSCFGNLKVLECSAQFQLTDSSANGKNKEYHYVLGSNNGTQLRPIAESLFRAGEYIIVSDENGHVFLANGLLMNATSESITIRIHRKLDMNKIYRIDKDEMYAGMSLARANILQLFVRNGDARKRDLIVDLKQPRFLSTSPPYRLDKSKFNEDQVTAIEKVLRAEDYALILGMPGTGKTTTIAALIRILTKQLKKTVLIASHTHSAVDNILLKFKDEQDMDILRLGSARKIHPDIHRFLPKDDIHNEQDLNTAYMKPSLVATTCLGINEWLFSKRKFDYCIIDEASQITLPSCIGPLRYAEKFVLVGDHYQLSPLVKNPKALEGGLDISLFKYLCTSHPSAVASLEHQYRMCEDIMSLSNTLIYDGRLKCGTAEVAQRTLELNTKAIDNWKRKPLTKAQDWLGYVFSKTSRVVFLNTDEIPGTEIELNEGIRNEVEADITKLLVDGLMASGVEGSNIGIISVYKAQVHHLQRLLTEERNHGVEILTADRAQGRDKDCVIVSLVRSNDKGRTGDLLRDWRRLNVSFTRSKSKLIIIGSHKTLHQVAMMKKFLDLIESRGWICTIPAGGLGFYEMSAPKSEVKPTGERAESKVSYGKVAGNKRGILRDVMNEMDQREG